MGHIYRDNRLRGDNISLHDAREDLRDLLNKDYKKKVALDFVCNHHSISKEDRNLLSRTTFSDKDSEAIKSKEIFLSKLTGEKIAIDTYNVIITMEAVLYGDPLVCDDGVIRDDAGVFGKYRMSGRTTDILMRISQAFSSYKPSEVVFFIDKQVSRSGELAKAIESLQWCVPVRTFLTNNVDHDIKESGLLVATADSGIIKYLDSFIDIPKYFLFKW